MSSAIVDLDRKISRAIDRARGMMLSPDQLDILVAVGVLDRLKATAVADLKRTAGEREAERARIAQLSTSPKSSDRREAAELAMNRARRALADSDRRGVAERLQGDDEIAGDEPAPPSPG